jgi:hypothetical protein
MDPWSDLIHDFFDPMHGVACHAHALSELMRDFSARIHP